ncbi:legumain-like [Tachysurus fulvidraco]|uniref:legumain-like n=1 Tax=Tachysurus fulvidraco TaxID=1234273 RepID=UPI000F50C828|nr:legumain-like [Tachysurus fulvidraco]XP_027012895.1 legumain-like [Tachysurus fulvidraco]
MMDVPDLVANRDVHMMLLQRKIQNANTPEEREQFEKQKFELHQGRDLVVQSMQQIVEKCTDSNEAFQEVLHGQSKAYSTKQYKEVAEHYREKCFDWHDKKYQTVMDHLYLFANLLDKKVTVERIKNAIEEVGTDMRAKMEKKENEEENEMEQ